MRCMDCESIVDDNAMFCPNCGLQLTKTVENSIEVLEKSSANHSENDKKCTNCQSIIDGDAAFCPSCGWSLENVLQKPPETFEKPILESSGSLNLYENNGTRGHSQQKAHTKFFYGKARYAHELDQVLEKFLISKGLEAQTLNIDTGIMVQGRKKTNIFNSVLGLDQAVTIGISVEDDNIRLTIGGAKWIDKAISTTIGLFVFAPLLLTAGWGVYKQKQLISEIEKEIDAFLSSKVQEDQ